MLDALYRAVEDGNSSAVRESLTPDAFVLGPEADAVFESADAAATSLTSRLRVISDSDQAIEIRTGHRVIGTADDGSGWVFDQITVATRDAGGHLLRELSVRVTALVSHGQSGPRVAAAYWSVPYETQAEQDAVKNAGRLQPGNEFRPRVDDAAEPLVGLLVEALADPRQLPELYSSCPEHVSLGSVTDEVFEGAAGRDIWQQFVRHVSVFVPRGPFRAHLIAPGLGWVAANIGIGEPPTPYRFFYVWQLEDDGWRIVVSHDGVSRNACAGD